MADSKEIIASYLRPYGLEGQDAIDAVWGFAQANPGLVSNQNLLINAARDTKTYKDRFAGNAARIAAKLPELSPAAYLQYEEGYRQKLRTAGMPVGFYDTPQDFAKFIGNDTDPDELAQRISLGYKAVKDADPQIIAEMKRLYMVTDDTLAAFFIDPTKSKDIVLRQAQAAQIAAEAQTQAQIQLSAQEAESISLQGIDPTEARKGFASLSGAKELFDTTLAGEETITRQEQISGALGTNAAAAQRIAARQRKRKASFEQGGGFAATQTGTTALGTVGQ
jgi:hypothetical protein